ncbi:MAG: hypothetical protein Q6365_015550, partial [Candidatus Sigynarchaeota archaeon]
MRENLCIDIEPDKLGKEITFISHAHADHVRCLERITAGSESPVIMASEWTRQLVAARFASISGCIDFHDNDTNVFSPAAEHHCTLVPCGHVLGARSLAISRGIFIHRTSEFGTNVHDLEFFYTGDFFTQPGRILPPLMPVKTEILACECTFGTPFFEFPPFEVLASEITDWIANA